MWNGSRLKPYEAINFFENNGVSQHPPSGTVARGQERLDEPTFYGTQNGALVTYNPIMRASTTPGATKAFLERGQERYNIYCQPCHGLGGYGDGMIVKRGFAKPPSYHIDRLRNAPEGHYFDVMTNGYGSMYSYANRVPPQDRWAIAAYIRVLQRSQNATLADVPAGVKLGTTPLVQPPINPHNMGPSAGREYHGTGPGGAGEMGTNGLNEEDRTLGGAKPPVPSADAPAQPIPRTVPQQLAPRTGAAGANR
ncbi:MAG: cytochrome c [Armatimonadetes bacterium]|nr:cytochrome c [Armatimonadota bacterium]